jgi:hypothetical protein
MIPKKNTIMKGGRKSKGRKTKKDKLSIINIPFSNKKSKGTRSSKGEIFYSHSKYININNFFHHIKLKNLYNEFPFIEVVCNKSLIIPYYDKHYKIGKKNLTVFIINISSSGDNHANVAIVNPKQKQVEFFEPHGHRRNKNSGMNDFGIEGYYHKKLEVIRSIFKKLIPNYNFINVVEYERKTNFQSLKDAGSGFCIAWCILFIHYRCLNPNTPLILVTKHIANFITTGKLLKYAHYIEKILKKY